MEYQSVMDRDDLIDGDLGEMGDYSVVELLVEQAEATLEKKTRGVGFRGWGWAMNKSWKLEVIRTNIQGSEATIIDIPLGKLICSYGKSP